MPRSARIVLWTAALVSAAATVAFLMAAAAVYRSGVLIVSVVEKPCPSSSGSSGHGSVASAPARQVAGGGVIEASGTLARGPMASSLAPGKRPRHGRPRLTGGSRIHLWIPAVLLRAGLVLVPEARWREVREKAGEGLSFLPPLCRGLAATPDGTLVLIEEPDQHVRIAKRANTILIDVDSADETVHVSVPLVLLGDVAARLASPRACAGAGVGGLVSKSAEQGPLAAPAVGVVD